MGCWNETCAVSHMFPMGFKKFAEISDKGSHQLDELE